MTEIIFKYKDIQVPVSFTHDEKMGVLIERFCTKIKSNKENLEFKFGNEVINEESVIEKLLILDKKIFIIVSQKHINNHKDEIRIKYQNKYNENNIRIFGYYFVRNNRSKCKIIYNGKEYELQVKLDIDNNNKEIEIILKGVSYIDNIAEMLYNCSSLISLYDISILDISNVTSIKDIFNNCSSLTSLPDISN